MIDMKEPIKACIMHPKIMKIAQITNQGLINRDCRVLIPLSNDLELHITRYKNETVIRIIIYKMKPFTGSGFLAILYPLQI